MKEKVELSLTKDQLAFIYFELIRPNLKSHSRVVEHCSSYCASSKELKDQVEWFNKMLKEIVSVEPIASLAKGYERIIDMI